jgi:di/tricarboxylate transporter
MNMWMLKGAVYGAILFLVFFVFYFKAFMGPARQGVATGLSVVWGFTLYRPLFWAALLLTFVTCCTFARLLQLK